MEGFHTARQEQTLSNTKEAYSGWTDGVRKITYSTAFVLGFLGAESAVAAEIPTNASLEEGIAILKEAAEKENFETAAAFITLPNGQTYWISKEGEDESVELSAGYEGDDGERVEAFLDEIIVNGNLTAGQVLDIDHYHNHPMQSMFTGYSGKSFSIPPSGGGFLVDGDTGFYKNDFFKGVIDKVEQKNDISISYDKHVIDAIGTWSWTYIDELHLKDNAVYLANQQLDTSTTVLLSDEKWKGLNEIVDLALAQLNEAYNNWLDSSFESGSPELQSLLDAYRKVGIKMSFVPHSLK